MASYIDSYNDLEELGIDCNNDSLTEKFNKAADHLPKLISFLDSETLLKLYALYKQGSQGPCNISKPSWYDLKAKSKWEAWNKLDQMGQKEAKSTYIEIIKKLDPDFEASNKDSWVSVSTLQNQNREPINKTIIDFVKEGKCTELAQLLNGNIEVLNKLDDDGLGLIHWASDRGSVEVLQVLLNHGVNINLQDSDGQTPLHYAASCGHFDCVKLLLNGNADRNAVNNDGESPKDVATDDIVKELLAKM